MGLHNHNYAILCDKGYYLNGSRFGDNNDLTWVQKEYAAVFTYNEAVELIELECLHELGATLIEILED